MDVIALVEVIPRSKGVRGKVFHRLGLQVQCSAGGDAPSRDRSGGWGRVPRASPQAGIERASCPLFVALDCGVGDCGGVESFVGFGIGG